MRIKFNIIVVIYMGCPLTLPILITISYVNIILFLLIGKMSSLQILCLQAFIESEDEENLGKALDNVSYTALEKLEDIIPHHI